MSEAEKLALQMAWTIVGGASKDGIAAEDMLRPDGYSKALLPDGWEHAVPYAEAILKAQEALSVIAGVEPGMGVHRACCARGSGLSMPALAALRAITGRE